MVGGCELCGLRNEEFMAQKKIGIIGAGVTGLTKAYCAEGDVTLFGEKLGGVIESSTLEGYTLESGPNVLVFKPHLQMLAARLSLKSRYADNYLQQIYRDGIKTVPKSFAQMLRRDCAFTWQERLGLPFALRRRGAGDDALTFFTSIFGSGIAKNVIEPAMRGIYGAPLDEIATDLTFASLHKSVAKNTLLQHIKSAKKTSIRSPIGIIEGGMSALTDSLLKEAQAKGVKFINERVKALRPLGADGQDGYEIECSGTIHQFDKVYIATAGKQTGHYLKDIEVDFSKGEFLPIAVLQFAVSEIDLTPRSFGVLLPQSFDLMGVMYNSHIFPSIKGNNADGLITVTYRWNGDPSEQNERFIIESAERDLHNLFNAKGLALLKARLWSEGIYRYNRGACILSSQLKAAEERYTGLHFIGSDFACCGRGGIGVADRVKSAMLV